MVRLKSRYILFEVLYPLVSDSSEAATYTSKKDILVQHHKVSPIAVNPKTLLQELRRVIQINFGDYGLGKASSLLQIKYFSNRTSTGIIRCGHEDHQYVLMALALMSEIDAVHNIIVNPIKISGTIKKIEQYAIGRNRKLNHIVAQTDRNDNFINITDDELTN